MNMHDNDNHDRDQAFDQAMRRLHAQAVEQVSPATRARLRAARHVGAEAARAPRRGFGWVLASGCAAVFALAIAMQLQPRPASTPATASFATTSTPDTGTLYEVGTAVAALDENPDLYLWLASNDDAMPATMEQ
ncbi:hypothetical protein ACFOLC_13600 [Lysobacter cavernae]|uniref:DUF3619 family protein n=1 Tax=Lysobacter cavernae TaxID=1685901 RepID=A0ABV7RRQ3_9GAMM